MTSFNCYKVVEVGSDGILRSAVIQGRNSVVYNLGVESFGLSKDGIATPLFAFSDLKSAYAWGEGSRYTRRLYAAIGRYRMKSPEVILDSSAAEQDRGLILDFWKAVKRTRILGKKYYRILTSSVDRIPPNTVFYRSIKLVELVDGNF